jgi:hypothetical protein
VAEFDVYCGIDVARETHHVAAVDPSGRRLVDRPLPNAEPDLRELFAELQAPGQVLVVVDQLASIGALAVAVARSRGLTVAYLPGLSMRRIADLYPGEAKQRGPPHDVGSRGPQPVAATGATMPQRRCLVLAVASRRNHEDLRDRPPPEGWPHARA